MSKYIEFLNWLLSFGPKLPSILASIERIVLVVMEEVENIRTVIGLSAAAAPIAATAEVTALEEQVIAAASEGKFAGPLQRILEFIRNNPELIAFLISLFTSKK